MKQDAASGMVSGEHIIVPAGDGVQRRQYMSSEKRERMIVKEALVYFSELGFDASIAGLANRLEVSEPLIFRHFPTKQALLDKVHEEFLRTSYEPEWRNILVDRKCPLEERIVRFYRAYSERHGVLLDFRLNHYSALQYTEFKRVQYERVQVEILNLILAEIRHSLGLPSIIAKVAESYEIEMLWALHGAIGFMIERRIVFGMRDMSDVGDQIANLVTLFLEGFRGKLNERFL